MGLLPNRQLERVAQELARMASAEKASEEAGYDTGKSSFASNARKRACRDDVKARVRELQQASIPDVIADTRKFIGDNCLRIASYDLGRKKTKVSDQIAAMLLLAKMDGLLAPTKISPTNPEGDGPARVEYMPWPPPCDDEES